jgi:hypothetical protein
MVIKRAAGVDTQEEVRYLPYERGSYRLRVHGMDFFMAISRAGKRTFPPLYGSGIQGFLNAAYAIERQPGP